MSTQLQKRPVEDWAKDKATPAWLFNATRTANKWARGRELTESEFDQAVRAVATTPLK